MSFEELKQLFIKFKEEFNNKPVDFKKCSNLLAELKIAMTKFSFLLPSKGINEQQQHRILAREVLELAAILSVKQKDFVAFERQVNQLKSYYDDKELPESQRKECIIGLYLLGLLAQNRIGKFHSELELIPQNKLENVYIKHPIKIEQYIMEGSYNKVFKIQSQVPADTYTIFMDKLLETVRDQIAACVEKSYDYLSLEDAQKLLMTENDGVQQIAKKRKWIFKDGKFVFRTEQVAPSKKQIPNTQFMLNTINYAKELERII